MDQYDSGVDWVERLNFTKAETMMSSPVCSCDPTGLEAATFRVKVTTFLWSEWL